MNKILRTNMYSMHISNSKLTVMAPKLKYEMESDYHRGNTGCAE